MIDAGFQELTRLGELPADDPDVLRSLQVVDQVIARNTPSGRGFYRYDAAVDPVTSAGTEDGTATATNPTRPRVIPAGSRGPARMRATTGATRREVDLRRLLLRFDLLHFDVVADFDAAVRIHRLCRRAGVTP